MDLSFCTTAMARPKIVNKTFKSFTGNISGIDFDKTTLYINIEPLPDPSMREDVIIVAHKYFGRVIYRTPDEANFTKAIEWLWGTATEEFIFHLEDDWALNKKVDINDMLDFFKEEDTKQVVFRAYKYAYNKMCLSPSIIRSSWAKRFKFDTSLNPEVQLRRDFVKSVNIQVPHKKPVVSDIGRKWIKNADYKKPNHKSSFTSWEKK